MDAGTLLDASLIPAMMIALSAGLLPFLSPCVLPIVPPYLAYMGGVTVGEMDETPAARRRVLIAAFMFVLGLSTVFLLLGLAASALGRAFLQYQEWFIIIAGVVVMIFGAHFVGVYRISMWCNAHATCHDRVVTCIKRTTASRLHSRSVGSRQREENGGRFNYKANGFMYANVRVSRRDADLITAATPWRTRAYY